MLTIINVPVETELKFEPIINSDSQFILFWNENRH